MELDFVPNDLLEDEAVEVGQNISDMDGIEGERCGICMDIIIDRGVLDCCEHWFCFECIDNWSTIMNLCPLCQSEFQLITCIPVYDTGGSSKIGEDSPSRDDEWCIGAETDALSSPSFFIDENAVVCLDGDGCKIRNGSTCAEGDSNLDTSIACDSCDTWYHALCVGFDPESASDDSWLCPRCLSNEKPHEYDAVPPEWQHVPEDAKSDCLSEVAFSGNFSVSVADDGETALVVSMVKGNEWHTEPSEANLSFVQVKKNGEPNRSYLETYDKRDITNQFLGTEDLKLSLTYALSSNLPSDSKPSLLAEHGKDNADPVTSVAEKECLLEDGSKSFTDAANNKLDVGSLIGLKRKHLDCSGNDDKAETKHEIAEFLKKSRSEEKEELTSKDHENVLPIQKRSLKVEDATVDILSIVKGTGNKPSKTSMHQNFADKSSKEGENIAGLRVKKIMGKAQDDKESSVAVEKLRKEIREAVRNKSSKDMRGNLFDPKLLAAFRAAMAGSKAEEPPKKLPHMALKAKKLMLQKGKVRENLTKKIYADSNGKRRSAWYRDCEIEFWKHRCLRTTKPEKVETLKSVLSLLRKNPVDPEIKPSSEVPQASNPILSRLYLADTSVFPRKDDVKPLSVFKETGSSENHAKTTEMDKASPKVSVNLKVSGSKPVFGSEKSHPNNRSVGSSGAASSVSKTNSQKETSEKLDDLKKDKRKWALEVLARKKALAGNNSTQDKQADNALLEGNYPLLAQLPTEMRPVLAISRHKKVPVSIRQTQLYRLTEHFLKKATLPVICRTAATELAVADAINIEKAIADKSNSKVVYLNLCSQEILHHSESKELGKTTESNSSSPPAGVAADNRLDQSADEQPDDTAVQEALRTAGLLSDSPPNSPTHRTEDASPDKAKDEGPDNIFEIDSNPEADIYGDFEYDLDDEDYLGATTAAKAQEPQPEEGLSKVKVVFSTVKAGKSSNEPDVFVNEETPANLSCLLRNQADTEIQNLKTMDGISDKSCVPLEPLSEDHGEDLSLAECEELYGPDKEPPIDRTLIEVSAENHIPESGENNVQIKVPDSECESNMHGEFIGSNFENSSADEKLPKRAQTANHSNKQKENKSNADGCSSIAKKVEAYIKEHIRPLCKSGVIKVDQYRWAVSKTTEKVMKYHSNAKNANFLIKEGEKVKKLAEQYVEAVAQLKDKS